MHDMYATQIIESQALSALYITVQDCSCGHKYRI
jgi:hypothetical protein